MASKYINVKALINVQYNKKIYKVNSVIKMKETDYVKLKDKGIVELLENEPDEQPNEELDEERGEENPKEE